MIRHQPPPSHFVLACFALAFGCAAAWAQDETVPSRSSESSSNEKAAKEPGPLPPAAASEKPSPEPSEKTAAVALASAEPSHNDEAPASKPAETPAPDAKPAEKPAKPAHAVDEIHGLLKLGASLTERADYDAAEIAYRQVINAHKVAPEDLTTALLGLAHMHRRQGELTKAAAIYERFVKDYPGDEHLPDAYLDLGRTLRSMGVYRLAIARFYNVINSTLKLPSSEGFDHYQLLAKTAQFEIAETHFQAGEYAEAAKFFARLRLLDLAPGDRARASFKSAYSQRLLGDLDVAVGAFKAFIEQWPDDENVPEARYLLAVSLRELKRPQEAFRAVLDLLHAEKSRVAADPKRWAYWQRRTGNQLANDFFESGDMMNAHAIYSSLVELSPEPSWRLPIVYQLALCYERLGLPERARASYQSIVDGIGAAPSSDMAELGVMATWRIEHLAWRDNVEKQVTSLFESSTGTIAAATVPVAPTKTAAP